MTGAALRIIADDYGIAPATDVAIRTLLTLQDNPSQPCGEADGIARDKLAEVNARIDSLMALKEELEAMVGGCGHRCVSECRVIEVLADHHKCLHAEH